MGLSVPLLAHNKAAIKEVVGIVHVFGDGAKLDTLSIAYNTEVFKMRKQDFKVLGRSIMGIYISQDARGQRRAANGKFVILKLNEPKSALLTSIQHHKPDPQHKKKFVAGGKPGHTLKLQTPTAQLEVKNSQKIWELSRVSYPIIEDFKAFTFEDKILKRTLRYNLFIPKHADNQPLPLVLFMHDAGTTGNLQQATLLQGLGALIWAHPEEQRKRPCYVLAPQYDEIVVDDNSHASAMLDVTMHLVQEISQKYPIDTSRIYTTGQSMGCMMSIALLIKYPHFFASAFLVAGRWDANLCDPLARDKFWLLTSGDDVGSFALSNAIIERLERKGAKVAKAIWDGKWDQAQFQQACQEMIAKSAPINYTMFQKNSLLGVDKISAHRNTWRVAYSIEPIRAWLFAQRLEKN
ncbi:peptidase [Helicobacter sp. NHP19-003]|uniref:Peptidase n=1 Tax=Helicobacter gastrocanis TaxID=2849641 RepID=A0ABM7SGF9_9HELI|nr:peptidase [Helicobacter sp. NHP19-003]